MPIHDIFSKRERKKRGEVPDVFQYKTLPQEFRVQVVHILRDALGVPYGSPYHGFEGEANTIYKTIHDALCREYGIFSLIEDPNGNYAKSVFDFLLVTDAEKVIDLIELSFKMVVYLADNYGYHHNAKVSISAVEALTELNSRFLEHGIGYQFESGEIIRMDSKLAHTEIIRPALQTLLSDKTYAGANNEFLKAHEHYRHGRYKECLNECLKSFESTMKAICKKQKWQYNELDTAKKLLEICFHNNLIPDYLQQHFSSLRSGLESGVPTVRNRLSGHGQGSEQVNVPAYIAHYLLNLTATSILMLCEAEAALPKQK
jgi:Domain of unknown function (DUF7014)/AbiJ N-terminal domain 4